MSPVARVTGVEQAGPVRGYRECAGFVDAAVASEEA